MTDGQLCLAIGVPGLALVLGMVGNGLLFNALSARMTSLEARMLALERSMNTRFDLIMGKLTDLDSRLSVLEDRSKRQGRAGHSQPDPPCYTLFPCSST